jgi:tRNA 2-thiouridine synthesizing protein A
MASLLRFAGGVTPCSTDLRHKVVDALKHLPYLRLMNDENILDATGLLCPLPVLKARKRLQGLASGAMLKVQADDPAAIIDIPHFCAETGHELVSQNLDTTPQIYVIRKK